MSKFKTFLEAMKMLVSAFKTVWPYMQKIKKGWRDEKIKTEIRERDSDAMSERINSKL